MIGGSRTASRARAALWRGVCWLLGGLRVQGRLEPTGRGCVVVANHNSHADTATLLAALPAATRPVFAAAADYWFVVPARRAVATGLAGILPVQRGAGGGYAALHAAAAPALAAGRTVVIFPEGTRSDDGSVATFRSGAVRLARDCAVPLVPAAVLGTRDVLPRHGRLRPAPMEVRIGAVRAADATDAAQLRSDVVGLLDLGPANPGVSPVWVRMVRLVSGPRGLVLAFCWGFAEASSWPVIAEMALVVLAAAVPRRIPAVATSVVAGSVAGVLVTARLAAAGVLLPAPLTTDRMRATARSDLDGGASGLLRQALDGIPVKVYARAAGQLGLDTPSLLLWTALERGLQMAAVAVLVGLIAHPARSRLRRCYGCYLIVVWVGLAAALTAVLAAWS